MDNKHEDNISKAEQQEATEFNLAEGTQQLERGLKSRHIQFLALGSLSYWFSQALVLTRYQ